MAASIDDFNVNPNQEYYVKIGPTDGQGQVEFFNTQGDAEGDTNRVAYATFDFGTAVEIVLTNDTTEPDIEIFNASLTYHLKATLQSGDPEKIIRMRQMTDLPEVSDPLLVDSTAILDRARIEIDEHTHTKVARDISLADHLPDLDIGDIVSITEGMRNLDVTVRVDEIVTRGDGDSLVDTIGTVEFKDVHR